MRVPRLLAKKLAARERRILHQPSGGYVSKVIRHAGYDHSAVRGIDVHGGLTFSGRWKRVGLRTPGYWIGFDCAHAYDLCPAWMAHERLRKLVDEIGHGMQYRDIEFVKNEVTSMAKQLHERSKT